VRLDLFGLGGGSVGPLKCERRRSYALFANKGSGPLGGDSSLLTPMGRRLRKKDLLNEIQRERRALDDTLTLLSPRQMTRAGVTRSGWSVKDVLAHLVEWQRMNLDWYATGLRGEKPAIPAAGYTLRELPRLNAMIYRKHHQRSLQAVMRDYHSYHKRVVELIKTLPDTDLVTLNRFSWTGPSWTLSDYLRASTAAHYLWARTRIRRWWRNQQKDGKSSTKQRGSRRLTSRSTLVTK
jgi:hypothetical protein